MESNNLSFLYFTTLLLESYVGVSAKFLGVETKIKKLLRLIISELVIFKLLDSYYSTFFSLRAALECLRHRLLKHLARGCILVFLYLETTICNSNNSNKNKSNILKIK